MKTEIGLRLISLGGAFAAFVLVQPTQAAEPTLSSSSNPSSSAAGDIPAGDLTRADALKLVAAAKKYVAHPQTAPNGVRTEAKVTTPDFDMPAPPPAPRSEAKPEAPGPGLVWVPGHYMPVKGEWRWVKGEWAVPALPISVWIPARYDEKEKKWDPGYWQPDVPPSGTPGAEAPTRDGKQVAPTNGY